MGEPVSPTSPKMFPSQVLPDEPQLCFNKAHFTRSDFNVERFMNLARRRASLKEIHNDLRIYLKSIQNSMIELINDDYADFVHLSSNLVALKEGIEKIDADINNAWSDFQSSTKDSIDVAQVVEAKCEELSLNRAAQIRLRNRIIFVSALERLAAALTTVPSPVTMVWLEQLTSSVVDVTAFKEDLEPGSREDKAYKKVMVKCEAVLGDQAVVSLNSDCQLLPLILSVLHLCGCSDQLVAKIVSVVLAPKISPKKGDAFGSLQMALDAVTKVRSEWSGKLGAAWQGRVEAFLDSTLLTFLVTYLDEHLVTVLCPTVPADTRQFHRCFSLIADFIGEWPTSAKQRTLLKQLRTKFQLPMFFKMTTSALSKSVNEAIDPEKFALAVETDTVSDDDDDPVQCAASAAVLKAIGHIWSEDVYLPPLADKLWDFTLRMLAKHQAWARAMLEHVQNLKDADFAGEPKWTILLKVRNDAMKVDQKVFDTALEVIWVKLRDLNVDTAPFGQCLTKYSQMVKVDSAKIDDVIRGVILDLLRKEFDGVGDVPRAYRWTKKPAPTAPSAYVDSAHGILSKFESAIAGTSEVDTLLKGILTDALAHFVEKADQVLQSVAATGSSLSRFKRREGSAQPEGDSDESKIRLQISLDTEECKRRAVLRELDVSTLDSLLQRIKNSPAAVA